MHPQLFQALPMQNLDVTDLTFLGPQVRTRSECFNRPGKFKDSLPRIETSGQSPPSWSGPVRGTMQALMGSRYILRSCIWSQSARRLQGAVDCREPARLSPASHLHRSGTFYAEPQCLGKVRSMILFRQGRFEPRDDAGHELNRTESHRIAQFFLLII